MSVGGRTRGGGVRFEFSARPDGNEEKRMKGGGRMWWLCESCAGFMQGFW